MFDRISEYQLIKFNVKLPLTTLYQLKSSLYLQLYIVYFFVQSFSCLELHVYKKKTLF